MPWSDHVSSVALGPRLDLERSGDRLGVFKLTGSVGQGMRTDWQWYMWTWAGQVLCASRSEVPGKEPEVTAPNVNQW